MWEADTAPVVVTSVLEPVSGSPSLEGRRRGKAVRGGLLVGSGFVVGLVIGALFVDLPAPGPLSITLDTFPTEVLGQQRDDIEWRTANSRPVVERLDAHFQDQLTAYRFAYGGDGAEFTYGEVYTLTIVNGRLAPQLPLTENPDWDGKTTVSLNSGDVSCVREEEDGWEYTNENGLPMDPDLQFDPNDMVETSPAWTECVLFDPTRNVSLRLSGTTPGEDALSGATRFRDVLETIHLDVTG